MEQSVAGCSTLAFFGKAEVMKDTRRLFNTSIIWKGIGFTRACCLPHGDLDEFRISKDGGLQKPDNGRDRKLPGAISNRASGNHDHNNDDL